ncbi:MAG TPA: caspase family protein, partial [Allocoleopsis sp.]
AIAHHDFAEQPPYLSTVRTSLKQIAAAARPQDTVLIYFSGHGILDPDSQQVVLCLTDTQKSDLRSTGLGLGEFLQLLSDCAAHQQLVWLDACHSGGMTLRGARGESELKTLPNPTPELVAVLRQRAAQSKGFYALLSCDQAQQSWEFPELGHGVFTYYLMRGLRGEAADSQGIIEADGLYKYVYYQTLQYVDKTNQQLRLINQQKRGRGETQLQAEYPLQTPKRIVEGIGELIIGLRPAIATSQHPRQALVVEGISLSSATLELSKLLRGAGGFELDYWPRSGTIWTEVRAAIQACLRSPENSELGPPSPPTLGGNRLLTSSNIGGFRGQDQDGLSSLPPEETLNSSSSLSPWGRAGEGFSSDPNITTALLYLRGQIEETLEGEAWLVLGDNVRISRSWLRQALRRSTLTQQIVILDCPGATGLASWIDDLQLGPERGQCLIAAAAPIAASDQFTQILLQTLQSADRQMGLPVAGWIAQLQVAIAGSGIPLHIWLSGTQGVIEVLPGQMGARGIEISETLDLGLCPYLGLKAFRETDAQYFYGRDGLVQKLLHELSQRSFLAVVGASGSGKSSVVHAGVVAQLQQGKQLPGSEQWWIRSLRPGEHPLATLAQRLVDAGTDKEQAYQQLQIEGLLYQGPEGFVNWLRSRPEPMVVLIVDQFEELFTLASTEERDQFLALIMGAVDHAGDRFKCVITLRADFIAAALEVPVLAPILQQTSVLVPPCLSEQEYRQVIVRPAEQVGLKVEPGLVEVLLQELNHSAGDLPLLEFVLEQLWEQREAGKLTLRAYQQEIGGLKGALERKAQAVYDSLEPAAQACTQWIFLTLTQLGEGAEDTRRRVPKSDLVVAKYPEPLVNKTLQALTAAKLVVVNWEAERGTGQSRGMVEPPDTNERLLETLKAEVTVEVAHEILIRHWSTLRWWLEENRSRLQMRRQLEQAAGLWQHSGEQPDFLLRGIRLAEAEELYVKYTDELSQEVQRFIEAGLAARQQQQIATKRRQRRTQFAIGAIATLSLVALNIGWIAFSQRLAAQIQALEALDASS